jgi:hypothetical protein
MRILNWKPLVKGGLRGFVDVELPIGLKITGITVMSGRNGPWCGLPSRPLYSADGTPKRDVNGKQSYAAILEWRDRDLGKRFSDSLIALLLEEHPDALGEGGAI